MSKSQKPTGNYNTKVNDTKQPVIVVASLIGLGGVLLHSVIISIFSKVNGILVGKTCLGIICSFI